MKRHGARDLANFTTSGRSVGVAPERWMVKEGKKGREKEGEKERWSGSCLFYLVLLARRQVVVVVGRQPSSSFVCRQSRIAKGRAHTHKAICHVGPFNGLLILPHERHVSPPARCLEMVTFE